MRSTCSISPPLLFALLCGTPACDVEDWVPTTADEAGKASAQLVVEMGARGVNELPAHIQAIEIQVLDVLVYRPDDDAWLPINSETHVIDLHHEESPAMLVGLPMGGSGDKWHPAKLMAREVELDESFALSEDTVLALRLDFQRAFAGRIDGYFLIAPSFDVDMEAMP